MNILIPHLWLLEQLETQAEPKKIAECLSLCGPSVERIEEIEGEPVYDIEVTTNRVDMMSVRGIAREAATILPEFGIPASLKPLSLPNIQHPASLRQNSGQASIQHLDLQIKNNPDLNHRILAIKLEQVQLGSSPDWMQKRLRQVGQRPLNNIIDITNYVMWEIGHPIHAFDYDRLTNKTVIVREAKAGEQFTTLDHKTHTCVGGEVVFDDGTGTIIDLPGIMGTANSAVTDETTNVLLWIEANRADKIRFASMTHALRSQAAVLNEKQVDPSLGLEAIKRGIDLAQQTAQASIGSQLYDEYPEPPKLESTELKQELLDTYMGLYIETERVQRILENLGCAVELNESSDQNNPASSIPSTKLRTSQHPISYTITPPTFRARDLQIPQDYIEEVARIYGYHKLPSMVMNTTIPDHPDTNDFKLEHTLKQWLVGWGWQEIYTYSMISEKLAMQSGQSTENHLAIANPLTDDLLYLRRSHIPSLVAVLNENPQHQKPIFELQNVYLPNAPIDNDPQLPHEVLTLTLVHPDSYERLKGSVESLLQKLHIPARFEPIESSTALTFEPDTIAAVVSDTGEVIGHLGQVNATIMNQAYAAQISVETLRKLYSKHPTKLVVYSTPPIIEDLTFTLAEKTYVGAVLQTIKAQSALIAEVKLKDIYQHNYTFTITYRDPKQNLSDKEVEPIRKQVINQLEIKFEAKLVGNA